jgi:hypothetical protein
MESGPFRFLIPSIVHFLSRFSTGKRFPSYVLRCSTRRGDAPQSRLVPLDLRRLPGASWEPIVSCGVCSVARSRCVRPSEIPVCREKPTSLSSCLFHHSAFLCSRSPGVCRTCGIWKTTTSQVHKFERNPRVFDVFKVVRGIFRISVCFVIRCCAERCFRRKGAKTQRRAKDRPFEFLISDFI